MDWLKAFDRPVAFHPIFVELTGSVNAALMLSQAVYWSRRTPDDDGWFYKSRDQWQEETALTRTEQEGARLRLRKTGFWQEELRGVPATMHYRIDVEKLEASLQETCQPVGGKPASQLAGNLPTVLIGSENNHETTHASESATDNDQAMPPVPARSRAIGGRSRGTPKSRKGKRPDDPEMVLMPERYQPSDEAMDAAAKVAPDVDLRLTVISWRNKRISEAKRSANWNADFVAHATNCQKTIDERRQRPRGSW